MTAHLRRFLSLFTDEMANITFAESFQIIITAMIEHVCAIFHPMEGQITMLIEMFIGRLPNYIRNSLTKAHNSLKALSYYLYY